MSTGEAWCPPPFSVFVFVSLAVSGEVAPICNCFTQGNFESFNLTP